MSRDPAVLEAIWSVAGTNSWQTEVAADIWDAMEKVYSQPALDLLVLDLSNDLANGARVSKILPRIRPKLPLILIGRSGDLDRNPEAVHRGPGARLARPIQKRELEAAIQQNLPTSIDPVSAGINSDDVEPVGEGAYFIGISPQMRVLRARIARLAEVDLPVLFVGEPGSGKQTGARLLHKLSVRSGFEFVTVNCAALPEELLEREIFGCGAGDEGKTAGAKRGKLENCDRGTIFLDQITEMPLRLQEKLLRVIRQNRLTRNKAMSRLEADARIVAASALSLDQAIAERRLLIDLAREFSESQVRVPALRERMEELPFLSRHFMHQLARRYNLPPREVAYSVSEAWQEHRWPGNLTELEESVKRYLVGSENVPLPGERAERTRPQEPAAAHQGPGVAHGHKSLRSLLRSVKEEAERNAIASALEETGWNRKAAARLLRTSYRTVLYKIEQYQISATAGAQDSPGKSSAPRDGDPGRNGHTGLPAAYGSRMYDSRLIKN